MMKAEMIYAYSTAHEYPDTLQTQWKTVCVTQGTRCDTVYFIGIYKKKHRVTPWLPL